jgi:hypothetical protein
MYTNVLKDNARNKEKVSFEIKKRIVADTKNEMFRSYPSHHTYSVAIGITYPILPSFLSSFKKRCPYETGDLLKEVQIV